MRQTGIMYQKLIYSDFQAEKLIPAGSKENPIPFNRFLSLR